MAIFDKLRPLKLPFGPKSKEAEDERLVQLFKNRAGLKKAYADLQDDIYDLKQRLKQQETATGKAQEQMESLETLLGNPQTGYGALVFYELRGLWRACPPSCAAPDGWLPNRSRRDPWSPNSGCWSRPRNQAPRPHRRPPPRGRGSRPRPRRGRPGADRGDSTHCARVIRRQ